VRKERVLARLLGLERAVVESVEIDDNGQVVAAVRPHHREREDSAWALPAISRYPSRASS
jgi:hypothetical protein